MDNQAIAKHFRELADLLEYHDENTFKIRSYRKAYDLLRKRDEPVAGLDAKALQGIDGIGKAISEKIVTLTETGQLPQLIAERERTPELALQLMGIRGLGPGKVRGLVTGLDVQSIGELLHAARENRVVALKGWSDKSQAKLVGQLEFYQRSLGKVLYGKAEASAVELLGRLRGECVRADFAGELARQCPQLDEFEYVCQGPEAGFAERLKLELRDGAYRGDSDGLPVSVRVVEASRYGSELVRATASRTFVRKHPGLDEAMKADAKTEQEVFAKAGMPFVHVAQREATSPYPPTPPEELITPQDIRGVVHAHTTYSDGSTELRDLVRACKEAGYEYLTVTDHSKVATYANGLSIDKLAAQMREIEEVNAEVEDFTVFSGTECDILRDGSLDYPDEVLAELDIVIASVHSTLGMSESDATARLIKAVEHPNVHMLGHPTGRLLLSRAGYPVDMDKLIDACVANATAIEINASPYRLDLDWTYVRRAADRGIPISINPDAHSIKGIGDIRYGVLAAQKAGLRKVECLNALDAEGFREGLLTGSFLI